MGSRFGVGCIRCKQTVGCSFFIRSSEIPPMEGNTVAGIGVGVGYAQQLDTETE